MAFSRFADMKRGPAVPQKEPVPDSAIVPELLVKVELGIMTKEVAKGLVQKVVDAEEKLFTDKVLSDPTLLLQAVAAFNQYKASVYSIGSGCFILGLVFLQIDDVDTFYHEHYKLGPGTLSDKLTGILISDSLRNKVNGANLIVRLQVKQEDYLRVRRRLENGIRRTTSVDRLTTVPLPPKETDRHIVLKSLDLATTSTQDSSFTHWVNNPSTKQLVLKMRKTSQELTGVEAKHEIALNQIELQEDMVRSLQREVTRLTQQQETTQKLLLDNKKEIQDLTGANKGMKDTIDELLADKTKLTNKLAMKEEQQSPRMRRPGDSGKQTRSPEVVAGSSKRVSTYRIKPVVLMIADAYGSSKVGIVTINCQGACLLASKGAKVYSTVLDATEEDKADAADDGVQLIFPTTFEGDTRMPTLDWLTWDHMSRYPDLPSDVDFIVGHVNITSNAARRIKEQRFPAAKVVQVTHMVPPDVARYKSDEKELSIEDETAGILEDLDHADVIFSVGPLLYDYYKEGGMQPHHEFLPKPSDIFSNTEVTYVDTETKVVLSIGRDKGKNKLQGNDLIAKAMGIVMTVLSNTRWRARGVSAEDFPESKHIIQTNLQKGTFHFTPLKYGTQEELCRDMQQAHVVLLPLHAESSVVGLEAIAAGVPVLVSHKSGLAWFLRSQDPEFDRPIVELEDDDEEAAKILAKRIINVLKDGPREFYAARQLKEKLLASKYWEESHSKFLETFGL